MRPRGAALAALVVGVGGCSALLDWNDFSGGADGGGIDGSVEGSTKDAGSDAPVEATAGSCGAAMECAPPAPAGWTGPLALYVAPTAQGAPPACGPGFDATPAFDGNAGLTAPAATCSACSCGAVTGVTCTGPIMSPFVDSSCGTPESLVSPVPVTTACPPIPSFIGVQSVTLSGSTASGGACTTTGGTATITAPAWTTVTRACAPSTTPGTGACSAGQVCVPSPPSPFSSGACVMQTGAATSCPAAYPDGPQVFYAGVDDPRGCSACQCANPSGATCSSPSVQIGTAAGCGGAPIATPSGCTAFSGGQDSAKLTAAPTVVDAGSCSLLGGGTPSGTAAGAGPMSFCCAP